VAPSPKSASRPVPATLHATISNRRFLLYSSCHHALEESLKKESDAVSPTPWCCAACMKNRICYRAAVDPWKGRFFLDVFQKKYIICPQSSCLPAVHRLYTASKPVLSTQSKPEIRTICPAVFPLVKMVVFDGEMSCVPRRRYCRYI
jgi:hypothetical protein